MVEPNGMLSFPTVSRILGFSSGELLNRFALLLAETVRLTSQLSTIRAAKADLGERCL